MSKELVLIAVSCCETFVVCVILIVVDCRLRCEEDNCNMLTDLTFIHLALAFRRALAFCALHKIDER